MRDPWLLIVLGAVLIVVPLWLSRWQAARAGKGGALRDRVETMAGDPTLHNFFAGLRIGIELAGAILIGIGLLRMFGAAV